MPATLTANNKRRTAFGRALTEAMQVRHMTQMQLGDRLGHMRQSSISAWASGQALPPDIETVFRLERVLKLKPGHLSRLLGFVPAEDKELDPPDVIEAIMADPQLDDSGRRMVLGIYEELVAGAKRRHPASHRRKARSAA